MSGIEPLRQWLEVWDRVCDAADPDQGPLPDWSDVRQAVAPEYEPSAFPTAEFFSEYMKASLVYLVRDLVGYPPTSPAPSTNEGTEG